MRELEEKEGARKSVRPHRSSGEVEAAIAAVLARPIGRSSVSSLSRDCAGTYSRTAEACAEVAQLREELAASLEANRLDMRIAQLRGESKKLRDGGGTLASDPLAELYAFLSNGAISPKDVSFWLVFIVAMMGELLGAFGFALVAAFAHATRHARTQPDVSSLAQVERAQARLGEADRDGAFVLEHQTVGNLMLYFSERTELTHESQAVDLSDMYRDYEVWCMSRGNAALSQAEFGDEFDRLRQRPELKGKTRKFGLRYYGIRLMTTPRTPLTGRRGGRGLATE